MRPNPEDNGLHVEFYKGSVENGHQSQQQGRPIFDSVDMIRITVPGNQTFNVDTIASDFYKKRFPDEWRHYTMSMEGTFTQGTPLTEWPVLSRAQVEQLRYFHFFTVEQIAGASDQQIGSIGMAGGMAPQTLREKAKAYLKKASDTAADQAMVDELAKRDQQIADLRAENQRQSEMMAKILAKLEGDEKRGPGRPRKEPEAA